MLILWILLGLLLLVVLALFIPLRVWVCYRTGEDPVARLRYGFVFYTFSPEKMMEREQRRAKKAVRKEYKKQAENEPAKTKTAKKAAGVLDTLRLVWSIFEASKEGLQMIVRHLVVRRLHVVVVVGGEDAAATGKAYGQWAAGLATLLTLVDMAIILKKPRVRLYANFLEEQTQLHVRGELSIRPFFVLAGGLRAVFTYIKNEGLPKKRPKKNKGGAKKHEPTTSHQ